MKVKLIGLSNSFTISTIYEVNLTFALVLLPAPFNSTGSVEVSLTQNDQIYTHDQNPILEIYPIPIVTNLSIHSGPVEGNTEIFINGSFFATGLVEVVFANNDLYKSSCSYLNHSTILCYSVPYPSPDIIEVNVTVDLYVNTYQEYSQDEHTFQYYFSPTITNFYPSVVVYEERDYPILLEISGYNFSLTPDAPLVKFLPSGMLNYYIITFFSLSNKVSFVYFFLVVGIVSKAFFTTFATKYVLNFTTTTERVLQNPGNAIFLITVNTSFLISLGSISVNCTDFRAQMDDSQIPFFLDTSTCNTAETKLWMKPKGAITNEITLNFGGDFPLLDVSRDEFDMFDFVDACEFENYILWAYPLSTSNGDVTILQNGKMSFTGSGLLRSQVKYDSVILDVNIYSLTSSVLLTMSPSLSTTPSSSSSSITLKVSSDSICIEQICRSCNIGNSSSWFMVFASTARVSIKATNCGRLSMSLSALLQTPLNSFYIYIGGDAASSSADSVSLSRIRIHDNGDNAAFAGEIYAIEEPSIIKSDIGLSGAYLALPFTSLSDQKVLLALNGQDFTSKSNLQNSIPYEVRFVNPPTINSIEPYAGLSDGSTFITIKGTNINVYSDIWVRVGENTVPVKGEASLNSTTRSPTFAPTTSPSSAPSSSPTSGPSSAPSDSPVASPSASPSLSPTASPSEPPTSSPSPSPSEGPTSDPSDAPSTESPSDAPTTRPSDLPTAHPSDTPYAFNESPSHVPTVYPSDAPSIAPSSSLGPKEQGKQATSPVVEEHPHYEQKETRVLQDETVTQPTDVFIFLAIPNYNKFASSSLDINKAENNISVQISVNDRFQFYTLTQPLTSQSALTFSIVSPGNSPLLWSDFEGPVSDNTIEWVSTFISDIDVILNPRGNLGKTGMIRYYLDKHISNTFTTNTGDGTSNVCGFVNGQSAATFKSDISSRELRTVPGI